MVEQEVLNLLWWLPDAPKKKRITDFVFRPEGEGHANSIVSFTYFLGDEYEKTL